MSSNLLKMGFMGYQNPEKRIIDTNEMMEQRLERQAALREEAERRRKEGAVQDGFAPGLSAEQVEGLFDDGDEDAQNRSNVIKANAHAEAEAEIAEAHAAAEEILEEAREKATEVAEEIMAEAREKIERDRNSQLALAREEGYRRGTEQAERELQAKLAELDEKERELQARYEELLDDLEPRFVDAITGVYEHLFQVELSSYREILLHLIASAVRKIEGGKDFLIHVSGEDFPYVSMEKKQLLAALASPSATLELVEDVTLGRNDCIIETDGGIYDCGLGTQLAELTQKLKLLSYEKV